MDHSNAAHNRFYDALHLGERGEIIRKCSLIASLLSGLTLTLFHSRQTTYTNSPSCLPPLSSFPQRKACVFAPCEHLQWLTCLSVIDIAVDGWALTLLSQENLSFASTCQTIGLNTGFFASFTVFLALNSETFSYVKDFF